MSGNMLVPPPSLVMTRDGPVGPADATHVVANPVGPADATHVVANPVGPADATPMVANSVGQADATPMVANSVGQAGPVGSAGTIRVIELLCHSGSRVVLAELCIDGQLVRVFFQLVNEHVKGDDDEYVYRISVYVIWVGPRISGSFKIPYDAFGSSGDGIRLPEDFDLARIIASTETYWRGPYLTQQILGLLKSGIPALALGETNYCGGAVPRASLVDFFRADAGTSTTHKTAKEFIDAVVHANSAATLGKAPMTAEAVRTALRAQLALIKAAFAKLPEGGKNALVLRKHARLLTELLTASDAELKTAFDLLSQMTEQISTMNKEQHTLQSLYERLERLAIIVNACARPSQYFDPVGVALNKQASEVSINVLLQLLAARLVDRIDTRYVDRLGKALFATPELGNVLNAHAAAALAVVSKALAAHFGVPVVLPMPDSPFSSTYALNDLLDQIVAKINATCVDLVSTVRMLVSEAGAPTVVVNALSELRAEHGVGPDGHTELPNLLAHLDGPHARQLATAILSGCTSDGTSDGTSDATLLAPLGALVSGANNAQLLMKLGVRIDQWGPDRHLEVGTALLKHGEKGRAYIEELKAELAGLSPLRPMRTTMRATANSKICHGLLRSLVQALYGVHAKAFELADRYSSHLCSKFAVQTRVFQPDVTELRAHVERFGPIVEHLREVCFALNGLSYDVEDAIQTRKAGLSGKSGGGKSDVAGQSDAAQAAEATVDDTPADATPAEPCPPGCACTPIADIIGTCGECGADPTATIFTGDVCTCGVVWWVTCTACNAQKYIADRVHKQKMCCKLPKCLNGRVGPGSWGQFADLAPSVSKELVRMVSPPGGCPAVHSGRHGLDFYDLGVPDSVKAAFGTALATAGMSMSGDDLVQAIAAIFGLVETAVIAGTISAAEGYDALKAFAMFAAKTDSVWNEFVFDRYGGSRVKRGTLLCREFIEHHKEVLPTIPGYAELCSRFKELWFAMINGKISATDYADSIGDLKIELYPTWREVLGLLEHYDYFI